MSQAFQYCKTHGGKVTTSKLADGSTVQACVIHGKRYMGQVKKKSTRRKSKKKSYENYEKKDRS